jgi:hypothetical protein
MTFRFVAEDFHRFSANAPNSGEFGYITTRRQFAIVNLQFEILPFLISK